MTRVKILIASLGITYLFVALGNSLFAESVGRLVADELAIVVLLVGTVTRLL